MLALGAAAPAAEAASFPVTTNASSGAGSLDAAITASNMSAGPDTITFASNVTGEIDLPATGDLDIRDSLEIQGPGASALTIDGNLTARIFDVYSLPVAGNHNVTISGLTLTRGSAPSSGGAIRNQPGAGSAADLTVRDSVITGNVAADGGGGIYSDGGDVTILSSTISSNAIGANQLGGGVYVQSTRGDGGNDVVISDSTFSGNVAGGDGGAGYLQSLDGDFLIRRTTVTGNIAGEDAGGFVFNTGGAAGAGGGLIEYSTFSDNSSVGAGGAIWLLGTTREVTIANSTISGNSAYYGGGINDYQINDAPLTITNSTVADNSATGYGGGITRFGLDDAGFTGSDDLSLSSTIVAGNTAPAGPDISNRTDMGSNPIAGTFSAGFSLIGSTAGNVTLTETPAGSNLLNVDPLLGPLADNGGPYRTQLPAATSPAVDAGITNGLTTDQRGLPRTVRTKFDLPAGSDGTDIGSAELFDNALRGDKLKAKKSQKQKGRKVVVTVKAGASDQVRLTATGTVKAGGKKVKLKKATKQVLDGRLIKLKLKPKSKSGSAKILRALGGGQTAKAKVTVVFADPAGNEAEKKARVKLK